MLLENSHQFRRGFLPGYEGTEKRTFFFYIIIIFCLNKEKDDIRSAYVYLNFFHETVNSFWPENEKEIVLNALGFASCTIKISHLLYGQQVLIFLSKTRTKSL